MSESSEFAAPCLQDFGVNVAEPPLKTTTTKVIYLQRKRERERGGREKRER